VADNLACIGFLVEDMEEFGELAHRTVEEGEEIAADGGSYFRWAPGGGGELWAQMRRGRITGFNPSFAGDATMRVGITREHGARSMSPLDGMLYGWAAPQDPDDPESGEFPFHFEVPDLRAGEPLDLPVLADVGLVVFAAAIETFPDEEAFAAAQDDPPFAAESFIPVGSFAEDGPVADSLAHGVVLDASVRTNAATGATFTHARIRTLGGELDVVAATEDLPDAPAPGAIVRVGGWTTGRVRSARALPKPQKRGLLARLRGRG
jgi:hypothetical protein